MKTICFDIDGVICKSKYKNYKKSVPIIKNIKTINSLFESGFIIKLYTARCMGRTLDNRKKSEKLIKKLTISQLKLWKVSYHKIFFGKPSFDILVDDKCFFFRDDWPKILQKKFLKIK
ncbi:phosphoheptose isomerase [Candidatus Pelagibacter sp. HIMB1593]|uniref:phosphoheptose isomerase n=1 Tax=Candidatus Pelagibacter sp. HIMB1593 TaxID=3413355 RepID=UPI003F82806B